MPKLCKRGHASSVLPGGRYTRGGCKECSRLRGATPEVKAKNAAYYATPEGRAAAAARGSTPEAKAKVAARNATPEGRAAAAARDATPKYKARRAVTTALWVKNFGRGAAKASKARARKKSQTCTCCPPEAFAMIYGLASLYGAQVDHVQPLALGGPHCRHNTQLLTPTAHKVKTKHDLAAITAQRRAGT